LDHKVSKGYRVFEGSKDSRAQPDSKACVAFKVYLEAKEIKDTQDLKELRVHKVLLDCREVQQDGRGIQDPPESRAIQVQPVQMGILDSMVQQVQPVQMDTLVVTEP
jgi:hypothetical protein